jgi:hypothetical protein
MIFNLNNNYCRLTFCRSERKFLMSLLRILYVFKIFYSTILRTSAHDQKQFCGRNCILRPYIFSVDRSTYIIRYGTVVLHTNIQEHKFRYTNKGKHSIVELEHI